MVVSSLEFLLSTLGLGQGFLSVLVQGARVVDDSRGAYDTLDKASLLVLTVDIFSLLVSFFLAALIKLLSTHFHLSLVLLGGLRSLNFAVSGFEIRVDSALLGSHSRVDVLVGRVHVYSEFGTRLSFMEVVWDRDSRLLALLGMLHGGHKCLLESAEIRHRLWRSGSEVEGDFHLHALVSIFKTVVGFSLESILVFLHTGRKLGHFVVGFSFHLNPLFSIVLLLALHLVPLGSKDFIGHNTVSEWLPGAIVSDLAGLLHLELLLLGGSELVFVERERHLLLLGLSHRRFLVSNHALHV